MRLSGLARFPQSPLVVTRDVGYPSRLYPIAAPGGERMKVALAGVGHWHAGMHAGAVAAAGAVVAAVWDPDPAVATELPARTGVPAFAGLDAIVAGPTDLAGAMGRAVRMQQHHCRPLDVR